MGYTMDYIKLSSSENLYNTKVESELPDVLTETSDQNDVQDGGFFWGTNKISKVALDMIKKEKYSTINDLLDYDLDLDLGAKDDNGNTVLHYLAMNENKEVLQKILNKGGKKYINSQNDDGNTPLHLAAERQNFQLCEELVNNGANGRIANDKGQVVKCDDVSDSENFITASERPPSRMEGALMTSRLESPAPSVGTADFRDVLERSSDSINTEKLRAMLEAHMKEEKPLEGGARKSKSRRLKYYAQEEGMDGGSEDDLERMINNQANEIHQKAISKIIDLMKVDEDTAKVYKNAMYRKIKKDLPDISYLDRAYEMEKRITKDNLKNIDIESAKTESEEIREQKKKEKEDRLK